MDLIARPANAGDATLWMGLWREMVGTEYPDARVYDPLWVSSDLERGDTWVVYDGACLLASVTRLPALSINERPVVSLGRHLQRPGSVEATAFLLTEMYPAEDSSSQLWIGRARAKDLEVQQAYELAGFFVAGFQPCKHQYQGREGSVFYIHLAGASTPHAQTAVSESLGSVVQMVQWVEDKFDRPSVELLCDGATGYSIQSDCEFETVKWAEWEAQRCMWTGVGVSGYYNTGVGFLRADGEVSLCGLTAFRDGTPIGGAAYIFDSSDRCVRIYDLATRDPMDAGPILYALLGEAEERFNAIYVEVDVSLKATRLLKTAEQLGFNPVACLPLPTNDQERPQHIIKLVKLNLTFEKENHELTPSARLMADRVEKSMAEQTMGVAVINLLRKLPFFQGLGDGELRKIATLFTQRLVLGGDMVFDKGSAGDEAYVLVRGQVDILLEANAAPVATFGTGQIFGELAFLDGSPRVAKAVATQPTILLVVQRRAFHQLASCEPHLGQVVLRNIAVELSHRLRLTNTALLAKQRALA